MHRPALVVIINGYATSGKDSFINFLIEANQKLQNRIQIHNVTSIKPAMMAAKHLAPEDEIKRKTPEYRKLLSNIKSISDDIFDTSFNYIKRQVMYNIRRCSTKNNMIFVHIREAKNIKQAVDYYREQSRIGITTLLVDREFENLDHCDNKSDLDVPNYKYDFIIPSCKLEDLKKEATKCLPELIKKYPV